MEVKISHAMENALGQWQKIEVCLDDFDFKNLLVEYDAFESSWTTTQKFVIMELEAQRLVLGTVIHRIGKTQERIDQVKALREQRDIYIEKLKAHDS